MKKFTKIFVAVLALALLVGGVVGISASAEENDQKWVISSNVSYADEIYPYFAIDATLEAAPANLTVTVDGEAAKYIGTKDIYGNGTEAHVYAGTGVAPMDMADKLEIIVTHKDEVVEETTYSVAQYFYERLYKNGIVNATTAGDLLKKELYIATLEYGAAANAYFAEKTIAPSPTNFAYVWGDVEAKFIELGSTYTIKLAEGEVYSITSYDLNGAGESSQISESGNYTVESSMQISLIRYVGDAVRFNEVNWSEYVKPYNYEIDKDNLTSRIEDGALVFTDGHGTYTGPITIFKPTANVETPNAVVFEAKLRMVKTDGDASFYIKFLSADNSAAYMLECRYDANTGLFYVGDKSDDGSEAYNSGFYTNNKVKKAALGEWVNVRVEYYNVTGDNESMRVLTYINGELVLTSNNWYGVTTAGVVANAMAASAISKVQLQNHGKFVGTFSMDDMKLEFTADVTPTDAVTVKYSNSISLDNSGKVNLGSDRTVDERADVLKEAAEAN